MITPSNWEQIRALFFAALERAPDDRAAFLRAQSDEEVRREVAALLAAHADARAAGGHEAGVSDPGARRVGAATHRERAATLQSGATLGPYVVVSLLGAGAMGEVYRARDTNLRRDVALKILPESLAADRDRLARFTREARTLGGLNHPHIAQVHGFEALGGVRVLVMELVEGQDLAQHLARGRIPVGEALRIARQIADALEAAHVGGIVHRDLKPANIMIREDGTVKVLDFGLAKVWLDDLGLATPPADALAAPPTMTTSPVATEVGVIVGTAAYMSPEQARGGAVDRGSDIWAFGCVLYEMLTGARAFHGASAADTLAGVLQRDPAWDRLPDTTPPAIRVLLRRCLRKDRRERLQDAAGVRIEIDDVLHDPGDAADARLEIVAAHASAERGVPAAPQRARGLAVPIVASAIVSLLGASVAWLATRSASQAPPVARLQAAFPDRTTLSIAPVGSEVAIAPDGSRIVYVGQATPSSPPQLFVRTIARGDTSPIAGTEQAQSPFLSPNGEMVAFVRDTNLLKVGMRGGSPSTICSGCAGGFYGGAWGDDGTIVFARGGGGGGLLRVGQQGQISQVTEIDRAGGESRHGFPSILPGGAILFMIHPVGDVPPDIAILDPKTGTRRLLWRGGGQPTFVPDGYLLFSTEGALNAVRFDLSRLAIVGTPVPVQDRVITKNARGADYAVSRNGSLVYASGDPIGPIDTIAWVDRTGQEEAIGVPPSAYVMLRVSADGQHAVLDARDRESDLWLWDFKNRIMERITSEPSVDSYPVWSRTKQGRRLYLASGAVGERGLFQMDLPTAPVRLTNDARSVQPTTISPDGRWLVVFNAGVPEAGLTMVSTEDGHEARVLPGIAAGASNADISPDGQWIAYQSSGARGSEIYVHPFPNTAAFRRQVGEGTRPLWSPVGGELFYLDAARRLMSVRVVTTPTLSIVNPTKILENVRVITPGRSFDISPDGKRFLVLKNAPGDSQSIRHLEVVLNWSEELRRLTAPIK